MVALIKLGAAIEEALPPWILLDITINNDLSGYLYKLLHKRIISSAFPYGLD